MISYHLMIIFILWSSYTSGQVPKCEEPPDIDFGERENNGKTEYHEGDKVWYQCSPGATLVGSEWIECREKNWTPLPKCSVSCIITKQQLEEKNLLLHNGKHRSLIIPNNKSLEFSCAAGYILTKPSLRTCVDGHMDFPTCIPVRLCDYPEIENGHLYMPFFETNEFFRSTFPALIGKQMYYHCNDNYVPAQGYSSSYWILFHCTEEGWSPMPECLRKCYLYSIENGHFRPKKDYYKEGDEITVECNHGYSLTNNQEKITCTKEGWSTNTNCKRTEEVGKCGPPPSINNGDIISFPLLEYASESRVEYRCQKFYVLQGSPFVTCKNGLWTKEPTCLEACTVSKQMMMNNNIELRWVESEKLYLRTGQEVEFSCIKGLHKAPSSPPFRARCIEGKINYPVCI